MRSVLLSSKASMAGGKPLLGILMEKGGEYTRLNIAYRMHAGLVKANSKLWYDDEMVADETTVNRDGYNHIVSNLPRLTFNGLDTPMKLRSFAHFIHVPNTTCRKGPSGSISNVDEARVTSSLVKALKSIGVMDTNVLTPYGNHVTLGLAENKNNAML